MASLQTAPRMLTLLLVLVSLLPMAFSNFPHHYKFCSWANEGCKEDSNCCSHSCHQKFDGTNPRCRHSMLGERCVFEYHCADDLICGKHYNCCSPYWKMCTKDTDCCESIHVCRPAQGFYYNRCLYPSSASFLKSFFGLSNVWRLMVVSVLTVSMVASLASHGVMSHPSGSWVRVFR